MADEFPPLQRGIEMERVKSRLVDPPTPPGSTPPESQHDEPHFKLDLSDALTPDPGTEDMFHVEANKFAFSPGQLSKLLNPKSLHAFFALGGLDGLEKGLRTDRHAGLSVDEGILQGSVSFEEVAAEDAPRHGAAADQLPEPEPEVKTAANVSNPSSSAQNPDDFADRKHSFKDNRLPEKKSKSILQLAWVVYNDKVLILLTIAALISLSLGLYETFGQKHEENEPRVEWVEGVAIIVAIAIVVLVGTANDWQMARQFNRLTKKNNDRTVKVIRSGKSTEISVFDVLVGDVMHLDAGDMVPVDGVFIQGHGVKCDESSATGESDLLKKVPAGDVHAALSEFARSETQAQLTDVQKLDPFIISGSKVQEGTGTFLVTAVGVNSSYGRITMSLQTEQEETPLQRKLNVLANQIAVVGSSAAAVLFTILLIKFLATLHNNHATPEAKGQHFLQILIVAVTVVVVAVPEGLPLAVTLALAFATTRMMRDNNLVRVLKACETMGNATTVCSDKTGTLTQNKMTVVAATLGNRSLGFGDTTQGANNSTSVAQFTTSLSSETKYFLSQGNALNSTAFEGDDENGQSTFIGSKTEVALLSFCRNHLGARPVHEERANAHVVQVVPFDSATKYMVTVIKLPNGQFRALVKGASEILLEKCKNAFDPASPDLRAVPLTEEDRDALSQTITSYANQSLRTIGFCFRDFESWPPENQDSADNSEDNSKATDVGTLHEDLTLVAIYGIKDPLRPSVVNAIQDCKRAGVVVRMVTGDNVLTGQAIASECGIYHPEDGGTAMEGPDFRRKDPHELKQLVPKLQVLARSSPEDKRILVRILKELGETVAVTGDGTNDAPALKTADIGFSMGISGTEVAKEASDIILMDDDFASIVKGLIWGRCVNDSVKKFLQFQLTVNITAVFLTFVTAVVSKSEEAVLNAVQLLWVNLIMDTFAALALATDPPNRTVLDRQPDRKSAPLVTLRMGKMIIGQSIAQLAITLVLNFAGWSLLGYSEFEDEEEGRKRLSSLVFNTFVWLQIFNEVNNRRLDNKLNVFENIHKNYFFIIINLIMIGGQVLIVFFGGEAFKIVPLDSREWALSVGIGALSLPWGALIRLFPDEWLERSVPGFVREWSERGSRSASQRGLEQNGDEEREFGPPLRTLSSIRGERARTHTPFRERVREKGERMVFKVRGSNMAQVKKVGEEA